jgi:hypothetical protein
MIDSAWMNSGAKRGDQEPAGGDSQGRREIVAVPPLAMVPGQHVSQPGAFRVLGETSERTLSEADGVERVSSPPLVVKIHQSRENIQGEYLAEAHVVSELDLVYGGVIGRAQSILEPAQGAASCCFCIPDVSWCGFWPWR